MKYLLLIFLLTSCGGDYLASASQNSQIVRKFTPRAFREQIFRNTPTKYNQDLQNGPGNTRMTVDRPENVATGGDSYGEGFSDGCKIFMSAVGEGLYRMNTPNFKPDRLENDEWYMRGYQDGATFCTFRTDWDMQ